MIKRRLADELCMLITEYPVVTIIGPRQAGKTTLAKEVLKGYEYSNLEIPEVRELARSDPKAYLGQFKSKVILDEIQRAPQLLSYIQGMVDEEKINGRFVLTGSHQLQLHEAVSQSLVGRTAILNLLPLSIIELKEAGVRLQDFEAYCYRGFLPRIYDQNLRSSTAYSNYYQTYIERDVRQLINLKDLSLFEKLMKLLAGRVGQLMDYNSLANDVGVDAKTIRNWISILEASFILYKLVPYYENFGKRVIKSPKYYFTDVGLLCFLLGIEKKEQVTRDPIVGNIFENLVLLECLKARYNQGKMPNLYFFRDSHGNEVDVVFQDGQDLVGIEIKSSKTYSSTQLKGLNKFKGITERVTRSYLIYNGERRSLSNSIELIHFKDTQSIFE